jgi:uncharacterized protein VirK/YbjX
MLLKRIRQILYLATHPLSHARCEAVIRRSGFSPDPRTPLKYVGNHLALSLRAAERRLALTSHYALLPRIVGRSGASRVRDGVLIWRKRIGGDVPDLCICLELSKLAPMEGELQLRFSFRSDLFVLTFTIAEGSVFGSNAPTVVFIGGVQGRIGRREEVREAAKLNDEISPITMLILAVRAIAGAADVSEILAIAEDDHVSLSYARPLSVDYARLWADVGGTRTGRHYRIPLAASHRDLSEVSATHRSRARRRREAKELIRQQIEQRVMSLFAAPATGAQQTGNYLRSGRQGRSR